MLEKIIIAIISSIIGIFLKSLWDYFVLTRNEKMFYSNEFLKLQSLKLNTFTEKLAFFHGHLVELQFEFLSKNKIDTHNFNKTLLSDIVEIDKSLIELSFFMKNERNNKLREKLNSIINFTKDIADLLSEINLTNDREKNIKNIDKIILKFDYILFLIKHCLNDIIPNEYSFQNNGNSSKILADENSANYDEIIEKAYKNSSSEIKTNK